MYTVSAMNTTVFSCHGCRYSKERREGVVRGVLGRRDFKQVIRDIGFYMLDELQPPATQGGKKGKKKGMGL